MEKALIERGASEELAYELVQKLTLEREHIGKQGDSVDTAGADSEMEISRLGRVPQAVIPQPSSDSGRYYICLGSRCKTLHRVGQGQCGKRPWQEGESSSASLRSTVMFGKKAPDPSTYDKRCAKCWPAA